MSTKKYCVRITEDEYNKYLKNVEEMERLIHTARVSCERVERMKAHPKKIFVQRTKPKIY